MQTFDLATLTVGTLADYLATLPRDAPLAAFVNVASETRDPVALHIETGSQYVALHIDIE